LGKIKGLWVRLGFLDADSPVQDLACLGCGPENECAYPEVRACAHGKGIDNCGLCRAYPCERMDAVLEKAEGMRARASQVCTAAEMDALTAAFFCKRANLDRIHSEEQ
jgi:hypothetical protein